MRVPWQKSRFCSGRGWKEKKHRRPSPCAVEKQSSFPALDPKPTKIAIVIIYY
jgi:hypothetical protein